MFKYNSKANYQPNGGRYLHLLSGKDLYEQMIVVSFKDTFPARCPNIFADYLLGQMHVGDRMWMHWNKAPMRLWQTHNYSQIKIVRQNACSPFLPDQCCMRAVAG